MGDRSRAPGPMGNNGGPRPPWFDASNPFLNPNPFAGNPFVQGNMSENPFDIGGGRDGENSGPTPLFGGPPQGGPPGGGGDRGFGGRGRGGWSRDAGPPGGGRGGGRGGRGGWRDRDNTSEDRDNRDRSGGGFRGGRGGMSNLYSCNIFNM